ncbi:MAG: TonB family protein [Cyanobacteria bacterium]|nr:TonB family protein [Cyanobacteria bacterium CG_2015-16_32_12]NCO79652.1 TonB family protein [Cyanobacteria bacterium CG_2015-22_32_23]NCQ05896.1 TonB family protein [Cyanobacteria bacterium CG_2015-09_32_10]NCQ43298.1 TonB family protein [Cyanobacteria bacterium CG_2015-04_32_10]
MVTTTSSNILSSQANKIIKEINWPLLGSITAHGLFFTLIFPQWNHQSKSDNNTNNFGSTSVVQLNSIEQTRLPNLNPQNSFNWDTINPLPTTSQQLPSLNEINIPPIPTDNSGFPPPNFDSSVFMNLPSPPSLPPVSFSPSPYSSSSNYPPVDYSYNPPSNSTSSYLPPPPPLNQNTIATSPPNIDFNTPVNGRVIDVTADPQEEVNQEIRQKIFANSEMQITANPRDIINGRINQTYTQTDSNGNITIIPPSEAKFRNNIAAAIQQQSENTSDEDARKNYVAWAKEVQTVTPKQLSFAGIYPKDACIGKLEGTATYGVTVNSTGNVVNTQLIKSSGYPLFNNQALRQIQSRNFANDSGSNQPYHVYVNFNYDSQICPSLSLSNLGETSSPTPNITPSQPNSIVTPSIKTPIENSPIPPSKPQTPTPRDIFNKKPNAVSNPIVPKPDQLSPAPVVQPPAKEQKTLEIKAPVENKSESLEKSSEVEKPSEVEKSTPIKESQPTPTVNNEVQEKVIEPSELQ